MKLKPVLTTLEGLPAQYHDLYTEKDGKFFLEVENMVEKSRVDEFRNNNITLTNQLKAYTDLGLDVAQLQEAAEAARKVREKELIDAGQIETLVKERLQSTNQEHERILADVNGQLGKANSQLAVLMIDNVVRAESTKTGVLPTAVDDVLLRARSVFSVKDGNIVATGPDGKPMYAKDGSELTVTQYMTDLTKGAPHLFQSSEGSGANTHQNRGGGGKSTEGMTPKQKMAEGLKARANA